MQTALQVGGLAAAAAAVYCVAGSGEEEADKTRLSAHPQIACDAGLESALLECAGVFDNTDSKSCQKLLDSANALCIIHLDIHAGSRRPSRIAEMLVKKREVRDLLSTLMVKVSKKTPALREELAEHAACIVECTEALVHNCLLQSSLNLEEQLVR